MPRLPARLAALTVALPLLHATVHAQQTERRTLSGADIAIYNLVGSVRIEGTTASQASVEIRRGGPDAARLQIQTGPIRGAETLRVIFPGDEIVYPGMGRWSNSTMRVRDDGTFSNGRDDDDGHRVRIRGSGGGLEAHADLTIAVPKGTRLALHLAAGDASVSNVDGDLSIDVSEASLTSNKTHGRLRLDTGSGDVHVTDADGELEFDTGSGEVTVAQLRGPSLVIEAGSGGLTGSDIDAPRIKFDLGSGDTRLTNVRSTDLHMEAGSGSVDLDLRSDIATLDVDSGSGDVTLHLPETLGAELDIDTGSGGVDSELPITLRHKSNDHLSGTIGDGKGRIRIDAGSGEVRLRRTARAGT